MKRIRLAWLLLLFAFTLAGFGSFFVHRTFHHLNAELKTAQQLCLNQEYNKAFETADNAEQYFAEYEHILALFLKREYLQTLHSSLAALSAYAGEEYANDFLYESTQIRQYMQSLQHLFFSLV